MRKSDIEKIEETEITEEIYEEKLMSAEYGFHNILYDVSFDTMKGVLIERFYSDEVEITELSKLNSQTSRKFYLKEKIS